FERERLLKNAGDKNIGGCAAPQLGDAGHHDALRRKCKAAQHLHHLHRRVARHDDVEKDDVVNRAVEKLERFGGALGSVGVVTASSKALNQNFADTGVVVDHENPHEQILSISRTCTTWWASR